MNAKSFLTALITLAASSPLLASEATLAEPYSAVSNVSRAEVLAAAISARSAGLIDAGEATIGHEPARSLKLRVQVLAEATEARRLGLLSGGEITVLPTLAQLERIQMAGLKAAAMTMVQG